MLQQTPPTRQAVFTQQARIDAKLEREHFTGVVFDSVCLQWMAWKHGQLIAWADHRADAWRAICDS